jgi:hypothetical protein
MSDQKPRTAADYPVQIIRQDGRFLLRQPHFHVLVEADDVSEGYARVEAELARLIAKYQDIGADTPPLDDADLIVSWRRMKPFFVKAAVIGFILLVPSLMIGSAIRELPHRAILASPHAVRAVLHAGREAVIGLGDHLTSLPPERKKLLKADIRRFVDSVRPYLREFEPLFEGEMMDKEGAASAR